MNEHLHQLNQLVLFLLVALDILLRVLVFEMRGSRNTVPLHLFSTKQRLDTFLGRQAGTW